MVETVTSERKVLAEGFCLTEAPRWRNDRLYFSDIQGHEVHTVDLAGKVETVASFDGPCSGLGFLPDGDLLVSLMAAAKVVRISGGEVSDHADVARYADERINDMIVDPAGRAYVTQLGPPPVAGSDAPRYTRIIIVEPDGRARVGAEGLQGPNGIGVSPDGRTLVVSESGGARVSALDIAADGGLSNLRAFAELPAGQCPDGLCLDAQGGVWAAVVFAEGPRPLTPGPGFCRYDARGRLTHLIPLEAGRHAVACTFGGADRKTLFLCTSGALAGREARRDRSARIETVAVAGFSGDGLP
ncbi:SMP-30/gluconolactonase/LRE family protein [Phenylobacterium sp.]|jgi:sugar lactone lactonase YvrE|uniref:SMP-30/gluconolactonase/LRE family protein n=1 Tax=Phenylobacterium sp. TaxID=1871053 RepID=UPI002F41FEAD